MRRIPRHLKLVVGAICAVILLPIATNIATAAGVPQAILDNSWIAWLAVIVIGCVAVFAYLDGEDRRERERARRDAAPAVEGGRRRPAIESRAPHPDAPPAQPEAEEWVALPPEDEAAEDEAAETAPQDSAPVLVETLPDRVRGRDDLLNKLADQLRLGGLVVLTGLGGMGKSTVARELIRRTRPSGTAGPPAWEVSGAATRRLAQDLRIVAAGLGAAPAELAAIENLDPAGPNALWRALEAGPEGWTLIVDNADDPDVLAKPSGAHGGGRNRVADGTGWVRTTRRGLVIVTSRQRESRYWPRQAVIYPVAVPSPAEAAKILLDLAPGAGGRTAARKLAQRLGRLPLALRLAGLYLGSDYAEHATFDAYRAALEADPEAIRFLELHETDPDAAERLMVMFTWELSLDALARKGLPQARPLLRLLSCYAPAVVISRRLLEYDLVAEFLAESVRVTGPSTAPLPPLSRVLSGLDQLGLIDPVRSGSRGLVVHPVVADTNRLHLARAEPGDPVRVLVHRTAVDLLAKALDPGAVARRPSRWNAFRRLLPHLQALLTGSARRLELDDLGRLIGVAGDTGLAYGLIKRPEIGMELIESALAVGLRRDIGPEWTLVPRQQYAHLLGMVGRHAEAEQIFRDVLAVLLRRGSAGDPVTLVARHNVACAVRDQGRFDEADGLFRDLVADERRAVGDGSFVRSTRLAWATLRIKQGRLDDAEAALRRLLDEATRAAAADDQFVLIVRYDLVAVLRMGKRADEAERARRDLADDALRMFGEDDTFTQATRRVDDGVLFSEMLISRPDQSWRENPAPR